MKLDKLVTVLGFTSGDRREISGLAFDSRTVKPGDLFVAFKGYLQDGHHFIEQAISNGAVALVTEKPYHGSMPSFRVKNGRLALGHLADRFYTQPTSAINLIGITGTNGKTTASYITYHILKNLGRKPSLLGTVCNEIAGVTTKSLQTTPDSLALHRAAARTRDAGGQDMIIEVSSHALSQDRVAGLRFEIAALTNLSQDHLDYHGTYEDYRDAKGLLFESLNSSATAVLNGHDPVSFRFTRNTRAKILKYGVGDRGRLRAEISKSSLAGMDLVFRLDRQRCRLSTVLVGRHNVENLLTAVGIVVSLGVELSEAVGALEGFTGVPGRLERVSTCSQPAVFVDYAHTDDALDRVLETVKPLTSGRLHVVFGCGGDRDREKRPLMAKAVAQWADEIYVTSDNPRSESPQQIADDTCAGLGSHPHLIELDRSVAIDLAIKTACLGDIVVVAGKGHENTQLFHDRSVPFDDREVSRDALSRHHPENPRRAAVA
jgi:UDP-N-acetylmuramoyl-L-alanyl-D-glutamate--2,6-diaminopimelate ligase